MTAPILPWQTTEALPLRGIDVSAVFPRPEDLTAERLRDVDFVFVRAAYGARVDTVAPRYLARLRDVAPRAHVAPYAFLRHGTAPQSDAAAQAQAILAALRDPAWGGGDWRIWFDLEDNTKNDGPWNAPRALAIWSAVIAQVCAELGDPDGAARAGIYTAPGWLRSVFPACPAAWRALPYWLAHWGPATGGRPSPLTFADGGRAKIAAWQFGLVDLGGLKVDGNVGSTAIRRTPPPVPAPPPPAPPPPPARELLDQLAAELDEAHAALNDAAQLLAGGPPDDPVRLHVARARAALRRVRA